MHCTPINFSTDNLEVISLYCSMQQYERIIRFLISLHYPFSSISYRKKFSFNCFTLIWFFLSFLCWKMSTKSPKTPVKSKSVFAPPKKGNYQESNMKIWSTRITFCFWLCKSGDIVLFGSEKVFKSNFSNLLFNHTIKTERYDEHHCVKIIEISEAFKVLPKFSLTSIYSSQRQKNELWS